ncbi:hypothetical protein EWM64_g9429 [Hericium alpestre]|uniref:Uncharacterized protein n=1 Tax=Hericium alpestre TaxID=135208 RepID=A0A4Y9ZKY8_9AGAM|nr:hypothetical protein EWM64_g9429 [Hericium alpestre]
MLAPVRDINLRSSEETLKDAAGRYDGELKQLAEVSACIATRLNAIGQNARIPPENPSLWTEMTYATSTTWLRENFARVQSLNLPVTLHRYIPREYTPFDNNKVELDLIDKHMSHIRELVVLMHPASMVYAVPLTNAAPLLESLTLSQYGLGNDEIDDDIVEPLSDDILAGHVPALRHLAVHGYIFSWTTSPLISASITHFELSLPRCALVQVDVDPAHAHAGSLEAGELLADHF